MTSWQGKLVSYWAPNWYKTAFGTNLPSVILIQVHQIYTAACSNIYT